MSPHEDHPDPGALGACGRPEPAPGWLAPDGPPREAALPHDTPGRPDDLRLPLQEKAQRLGLWSLSTPAEFGCAGLGVLGQAVVAEEAAKCRMGAYFPALGAFGGNPPSVMFSASPGLFEKYAAPLISGRPGKA